MVMGSWGVDSSRIMRQPRSWVKVLLGTSFFVDLRISLLIALSSEVHKAIRKANGTLVALKRILMHNEKEGMPVTALREIKILKALKHPSIVNILDMFVVRSTS